MARQVQGVTGKTWSSMVVNTEVWKEVAYVIVFKDRFRRVKIIRKDNIKRQDWVYRNINRM